jgi:hypothetical protein
MHQSRLLPLGWAPKTLLLHPCGTLFGIRHLSQQSRKCCTPSGHNALSAHLRGTMHCQQPSKRSKGGMLVLATFLQNVGLELIQGLGNKALKSGFAVVGKQGPQTWVLPWLGNKALKSGFCPGRETRPSNLGFAALQNPLKITKAVSNKKQEPKEQRGTRQRRGGGWCVEAKSGEGLTDVYKMPTTWATPQIV